MNAEKSIPIRDFLGKLHVIPVEMWGLMGVFEIVKFI